MTPGVELIQRMARGDRQAFAPFYDRYAGLSYSLIVRIVRDREEANDVLQEVFWEAWQAAGAYDPSRGTPEAWLVTRARSRAIDRVRAIRRRGETFTAPVDEALAAGTADPAPDAAERAADRARLRNALERLPEGQREVVELAYWGGLTQTEIARRLEQPLGTVKTRIRLGLERLREVIGAAW